MPVLLDLPVEILDDILKEAISDELELYLYDPERSATVLNAGQIALTCRIFYESIRRHLYACCELEFERQGDIQRTFLRREERLKIYKDYGYWVRILVIHCKASYGDIMDDDNTTISRHIHDLLPHFSSLRVANFYKAQEMLVIPFTEGIKIVVTECLGLKELFICFRHYEHQGLLTFRDYEISEVDPSHPHARLEALSISFEPYGTSNEHMTKNLVGIFAKILTPATKTVTRFAIHNWEISSRYWFILKDSLPTYEETRSDRLWPLPAMTTLIVKEKLQCNIALDKWFSIDPKKVTDLKIIVFMGSLYPYFEGTYSKRISEWVGIFPNVEFVDIQDDLPENRDTINHQDIISAIERFSSSVKKVRTTVSTTEEITQKILGPELIKNYDITYGPHNLYPRITDRKHLSATIHLKTFRNSLT
ncbi:hypothetical protein H072_4792 [Dactylellina haptotyla CBS 200.50]|uniref:Uncharacterized protein n=1 Tax=Dactylellina haptotyla (strain CBS 200.50) TaxID=1284197 RepID=S8BPA2_DACHA|nr:hypothetical protein H072_4792 [Dactylellina haptotyla CBS 200.50]